jgi:hypoxanthine phosphoribosyltransferase
LRKRGRQVVPVEPDYCGFDIPNVFVVGYGLDYNDEYRNLPDIAVVSDELLHSKDSLVRPGLEAR